MTCPIEGCIRAEGIDWGHGPTLCVPHRAEWAADHEKEITDAEWERWANEFAYDSESGNLTLSTWPDQFKTVTRPSRAQLEASNAKVLKGWKADREEAQRKRLEAHRDQQQYEPGFGQQRWGNRR